MVPKLSPASRQILLENKYLLLEVCFSQVLVFQNKNLVTCHIYFPLDLNVLRSKLISHT